MKDFDELLDGILQENSSKQPRLGLEARVIARVRADGQRQSGWRFVTWGAAAASLAVCVVALLVWPRDVPPVWRSESAPVTSVSPVAQKADIEPVTKEKLKAVQFRASVRPEDTMVTRVDNTLPKLNVFPSPATEDMFPRPVKASEKERQLTESRTKEVAEALATLQQEQNQPLRIAAIEIAPL